MWIIYILHINLYCFIFIICYFVNFMVCPYHCEYFGCGGLFDLVKNKHCCYLQSSILNDHLHLLISLAGSQFGCQILYILLYIRRMPCSLFNSKILVKVVVLLKIQNLVISDHMHGITRNLRSCFILYC